MESTSLSRAISQVHVVNTPAPRRVFLSDVIDVDSLNKRVYDRHITKKESPDGQLSIYKYSKIVGTRVDWDEVNILTRGLIVDNNTGEIVSRGFNKFFTIEQLNRFGIDVDTSENSIVTPKEDGSLGIAYHHNGQWGIATQSSFTSEQAIHATQLFRTRYGDIEPPRDGTTMLFEIIYPENRIVTKYNNVDTLILIGGADKYGRWVNPDTIDFDGDRVTTSSMTVGDMLSIPDPNDTREGFIARTESGLLVKHKFDSYLKLHKAKYSMTPLFVWEMMSTGKLDDTLADTPDEFQQEMMDIANVIDAKRKSIMDDVTRVISSIPQGSDRKHTALWINEKTCKGPVRKLCFMSAVDKRNDIENSEAMWNAVRPKNNNL